MYGSHGSGDDRYLSGCITTCLSLKKAADDGQNCTGLGCCQTTLPSNLDKLKVGWSIGNATPINRAWKYSSCNYGFVASKGWYHFKRRHLSGSGDDISPYKRVPLVLDWAIPASKVGACVSNKSHPEPVSVREGQQWYVCKCSDGYRGNPYIDEGCKPIDKCGPGKPDCGSGRYCIRIDGTYQCKPIIPAKAAEVIGKHYASFLVNDP
ncbi:unnamed protein product [Urochloa humidicola]